MNDATKTTGNLFVNDYKKADKQPDYTGSIEISREQIDALIEIGQGGGEPKLKVGCWVYPSKRDPENEVRFFLVAEPNTPRGDQGQQQDSGGWGQKKAPKVPF